MINDTQGTLDRAMENFEIQKTETGQWAVKNLATGQFGHKNNQKSACEACLATIQHKICLGIMNGNFVLEHFLGIR